MVIVLLRLCPPTSTAQYRRVNPATGSAELVALGLDPSLLRDRSIVTPAAGLGDFALPQAERVVQLASELSDRLIEFTRSAIAPPSRR